MQSRRVFADYETARRHGSKKCEEEHIAIPRFSPHNILQPELPGREECIGISSGNSMHKAGGECLTWDSCEIPAEEGARVVSQRKDRFEYQFFRIPFGMEAVEGKDFSDIWRQIFRRWKRCRMRSREHTGFAGEAETIWDKVY